MAQTIVQLLAPPELRGRLMGLFIMSSQGLRTFSGVSVGLLGSYIGIHWSLGLSTGLLFLFMLGLLAMTPRSD
jgi:MFS-type transporter involved in bile tolerance (Atg22 family)